LALSHGTLVRLGQLGVHADITRIQHIHVSAKGHLGSMEIRTDRVGVHDLGGLIGYASLLSVLRDKIQAEGIPIYASIDERDAKLAAPAATTSNTTSNATSNASVLATPGALIIAEGGVYQPGQPPSDPGMKVVRDYGQRAVIGWVWTEPPCGDTAWERFTDDGVVALLPVKDRYALIWCGASDRAEQFSQASSQVQAGLIADVMPRRVDPITRVEITGSYPLGLKWRDQLADGTTAWIGNSAQALHPVAGQGLNLGVRDAETIAACMVQRGLSIPERLNDYAQRRRIDRWAVRSATDTLATRSWVRRAIGAVAITPGAKKLLGQVLMYGG
jgi:2-octaprenyl-6-methoxyphenol hydroxylase